METELPIKPVKKKVIQGVSKRIKPVTKYDVVADVLDKPANITVRDLLTENPKYRRRLTSACKSTRTLMQAQGIEETIALIEDEETDTTAVYSQVIIESHEIRTLIDCGAAKTCISKSLADALNLKIDTSSENVFTLGNGSRQPALGIIYDVPIAVNENLVIPCNVEVLPYCPSHFIIGNNWLNRAKARIDFNNHTLKVVYKGHKAELPIVFTRIKDKIPKMTVYTQRYQDPISLTNSSPKKVHFEKESYEDSEDNSEESYESESSEDSSEEEYTSDQGITDDQRSDENVLMVLEENEGTNVEIVKGEAINIIRAPDSGMTMKANTSNTFYIEKSLGRSKNTTYSFELTGENLIEAMGYFDLNTSIIINKKNIEIHLYNRTHKDIYLQPHEEIGQLESFDLQEEEAQGFDLNDHIELFALEQESKKEEKKNDTNIKAQTLPSELYSKIEIGEIQEDVESKLKKLIHNFYDIFDWNNDTIGYTSILKHKIIIEGNTQPISHKPYRLSPIESDYLQKELEKYCKLGVISPSNSPWAAPVILVKKKNGEYRMVIDYRKLNAVTKKDSYPLPRIDDLLDTLGKAKVFSALDMRAGFHQVPVEENSKELTAFTTKYGVYHYNTLPMGLVNSPATFQRLIDLCFRPLINKCLVAYIDDLNIYSQNPYEHLVHLEQVFNCIKIANLKLNPEKCFFFKDHLKFLGYIVTKDGLETDPSKIEKIQNYPIPKTLTQIRGFLGLASYYRRFIQNFAAMARPLHDQTKTTKKIPWSNSTTECFNSLKKSLTEAPILVRPDFNRPFILVTDASRNGLGCILTQLDDNGHEHPVIYASRSLKSSESNYGVSKLECLAVIWAVKQFRPYLLGRKFTIITDHSALKGLLNTTNPTGIIARWITILSEYEYDIKYRPGRVNESADFLSRLGY